MKKQIIASSIIAAIILSSTIIATTAKANSPKTENQLLAENSVISAKNPVLSSSKNETVYIIADENGNPKTKFIGSTIYDGTQELPFDFKVTFHLNDTEISANELKGKSGHIKIVYNYTSTATYNGKFIPFLALTTMTLDHNIFTNIKLTNGKIIDEKSDSYIIAGYSIAGINKNLNTDLLPDTFIIEADTTNFKLNDTYTVFTNDVLADLDTSKLNRLDEVTNSIYKLEDGINQLVNGATELSNGIAKTIDGTKTLYVGSQKLIAGFEELNIYSTKLTNGAEELIKKILIGTETEPGLNPKISTNEALMTAITYYGIDFPINTTNYKNSIEAIELLVPTDMAKELEQSKQLLDLTIGTIGYIQGVSQLSEGATTLSTGINTLLEGENQLYQGSITLKDGLTTFKTSGIDKLVNFASKDLSSFTRNLRASVTAASSYKNFGNVDAKSVKFIVKTPSI